MQQGVQMDATCNIQQCWELLAQNVTSLCTGFQADSANSSKRWTLLKASAYRLRRGTNTGRIRIQSRIRQNLRSHTNILHTDLEGKWTPWPPVTTLAFTPAEVTLCLVLVILRLLLFYWGTQLKPLWRREAFLYGVYFFRKTLFHLDDHTISNNSTCIYML